MRIGIDRPAAQATAPVEQLTGDRPLASFDTVTFTDVADSADRDRVTILDVRRNAEWTDGHIAGARHIPLHELLNRVDEIGDEPVWVHCASGFRATIAASILDAAGKDVTAIVDDYEQAEKAGLQLTAESA